MRTQPLRAGLICGAPPALVREAAKDSLSVRMILGRMSPEPTCFINGPAGRKEFPRGRFAPWAEQAAEKLDKGYLQGLKPNGYKGFTPGLKPRPPKEECKELRGRHTRFRVIVSWSPPAPHSTLHPRTR